MPIKLIRPGTLLPDDRRKELGLYLQEQWQRAESARTTQVDDKYSTWQKAYSGVPLEEVRTVPFHKASNFVVKLIRMFLDTFVARTLNIVFATKPLYVCDGLPQELREAWELYINRKALYDWDHYQLCRDISFSGNKNGTAVTKSPWIEKATYDVMPLAGSSSEFREERYIYYAGPESRVIPFDDFYLYPITATRLCDAEIIFHRIRLIEEDANRRVDEGDWELPEGQKVSTYMHHPNDIKRGEEQSEAGVVDPHIREMTAIECHFDYAITNDSSKQYSLVATLEPSSGTLLDLYYCPYPRNLSIFQDYRPFPREDLFFGESMSELLGQSQEEASRIHNERRDNSTIASAVCFKRRQGSLLPNPSTNWYPGKVWDLEDMTDLEAFEVGRNYTDMIPQEQFTLQLAERLSGIGEIMQGASQGSLSKRGIYNTGGTLGVIAEGNQRQDTNIRDVRAVMGAIAKTSSKLQATYGATDPMIDTLPKEAQPKVREALALFASDRYRYMNLEVKASNAGANSEIRKSNLMAMSQAIGQYGQTVMQISQQLANPQLNQSLRLIMNDIIESHRWMAKRLLKEFDEWDATETLPDVLKAIATTVRGGDQTTSQLPPGGGQQGMEPTGFDRSQLPNARASLESLAALPPTAGSNGSAAGMGGGYA